MSPRPQPTTTTERPLRGYLQLLAGERPAGKLLEIRHTRSDGNGMGQLFVPARRLDLAERAINRLSVTVDVYVGVLLRTRRRGDSGAVHDSHLLFCDIDRVDAQDRLDAFAHPPTATVATSPGRRHAYWQLRHPIAADQVAAANRRLAHALGADLACTDSARILRPPGTVSRKHSPPAPVELIEIDASRRYRLDELLDDLRDPPGPRTRPTARRPPRAAREPIDELLLAVPAAEYAKRLVGLTANRAGKVSCPFHDQDRTPSLQLYPDGSWYCFGCARGGSVYDFGAHLYRLTPRGQGFLQLRERLAAELLAGAPTPRGS